MLTKNQIGLILAIVLLTLFSFALKHPYNTNNMMTLFAVAASWFSFGKIAICYYIFPQKTSKLPITFIIFSSIIGLLITMLLVSAYTMTDKFASAAANFKQLSWSLAAGWSGALAYWGFFKTTNMVATQRVE